MAIDFKFPQNINSQLDNYINYAKTTDTYPNILLIGCPKKYLAFILEKITHNLNAKHKLIDYQVLPKQNIGDFLALITNISENEIIAFNHPEYLNHDVLNKLTQVLSTHQINITLGKGSTAKNMTINLNYFGAILSVDDITQIPSDMIESFYDILDFRKFDYDIRMMNIADFAKKYNLYFTKPATEILAKKYTNEEQLRLQLIEIRNKAYKLNTKDITENFLLEENSVSLPFFEELETMSGRDFELFTGNLFKALGYTNVTVTQSSGDFGADVIVEKDDIKFAIQCKRYNAPVGISAIQEVLASKSLHDCHVACVLTNNTFTSAAKELARKNLVVLWDGNKLKTFIEKARSNRSPLCV